MSPSPASPWACSSGAWPMAVALVVAVAAALGIMKLKEAAGLHGDTAIAILSSVGMALGIILASVSGRFNVALLNYLFGEILAIEPAEVVLSIGLAAARPGRHRWSSTTGSCT